jgi:hypothetical protein
MVFKDFLFKKYRLPGSRFLTRIPSSTRKATCVFLLIFIFFIALQFLLFFASYLLMHIDIEINVFDILIMAAFLPAALYVTISLLRKQPKARTIFNAAQMFAFLSLLPYITALFFDGRGNLTGGKIWNLLFHFGCILPEVVAFIAFGILKRNRVAGYIVLAITLFAAIEILPIRRTLFVPLGIGMFEDIQEYGDGDLEFEFSRSIEIIKQLAEKSEKKPKANLFEAIIYLRRSDDAPDLPEIYPYGFGDYERRQFLVDITIDSDNDGLGDFREAELLSDAFNKDTDGDGIADGEDTDPLNEYRASQYGEVKSAIIRELGNDQPFYFVHNGFNRGLGEFENFDGHVILLNNEQETRWHITFGSQHRNNRYYEHNKSDHPWDFEINIESYGFGGYKFDLLRRVALVDLDMGFGGGGWMILLIKWRGKWHAIREFNLWI